MGTQIWFELGYYFFEDVALYVSQISDNILRAPDNIHTNRTAFIEGYENGEYGFEVTPFFPGDKSGNDLLLIFSAATVDKTHLLEGEHFPGFTKCISNGYCINKNRGAMLVPIPEPVKDIDIFFLIPSVVKLYGLYPVVDRLGELVYLKEITLKKLGFGFNEFQIKSVTQIKDLSNAPDQIVKNRSQIMNDIPKCEANRWRRLVKDVQLIREKGVLPFTLHASENFTWFGIKEGIDQYFKAVNACTCPVKPQLSKFHVIIPSISTKLTHELYYPQGENNGKEKTKDSEGARDTRAHKKGIPRQSKKGNQVNASQPEEVRSQTSHDLRSGGYTAKNTHSGSLEDA